MGGSRKFPQRGRGVGGSGNSFKSSPYFTEGCANLPRGAIGPDMSEEAYSPLRFSGEGGGGAPDHCPALDRDYLYSLVGSKLPRSQTSYIGGFYGNGSIMKTSLTRKCHNYTLQPNPRHQLHIMYFTGATSSH